MVSPKPVVITQGANPTPGVDPEPLILVSSSFAMIDPQTAPAVDTTPADATAVATDLNALRTALIAAGVLTA